MSEANTRIVLASRPQGWVTENNFRIERLPLPQAATGRFCSKLSTFRSTHTCAGG